jgi:hypothetical protein
MNNAEHIGSAGPANTNSGEEIAVVREGKALRFRTLQAYGRTNYGMHAIVLPGDSITVYGVNMNHVNGPQAVDRTYNVGDACTCGGRNVDFIGTVVSIGPKTVTVRSSLGTNRFTVGEFAHLNKDFDQVKVEARNASWMD